MIENKSQQKFKKIMLKVEDTCETDCLCVEKLLQREENKFIHLRADTLCQKEFSDSFQILGKKIGPFKVGHTYNLEIYIAKIFVEQGYLVYTDEFHINSNTIQKINFQESTTQQLNKIHDLIYIQAFQQVKIAKKYNEQGKMSYRQMKQLMSDVNDLMSVRVAKILRLARHSKNNEAKKRLTSEELILFKSIASKIQEWQNYLGAI